MKIAIIGAGAMGSLFGAYLKLAGHSITFIDRGSWSVKAINQNGLRIEGLRGDYLLRIPAAIDSRSIEAPDLVMLMVKSFDTGRALAQHAHLFGPGTPVLTLQNGIGNIEEIEKVVERRNIIAGSTTMSAFVKAPGVVQHTGEGKTHIGVIEGDSSKAETVAAVFNAAGLRCAVQADIRLAIWTKLIYNSAINAFCALTRSRNGAIARIDEARVFVREILEEGRMVAEACGINLDLEKLYGKLIEISENTANNRNSMLADLLLGKQTEIDSINGAIARIAAEKGLDAPINRILTTLIKSAEKIPQDFRVNLM